MTITERLAKSIAGRVDPAVGLDPATIIMVVCALINVAINCWRASHSMNADEAQDYLARQYKTNPTSTRWRLTLLIRRKSRVSLRVSQAEIIADAMIAEALDKTNKDVFTMLVKEADESIP